MDITTYFLLLLSGDIHSNPGPVSLSSTLTFSCLNYRSVSSISPLLDKPAFLQDFISDHSIDILAVTETWLTPATLPSTLNSLSPPGYSILHSPRLVGKGGGLALIFRSFLKISSISLPLFSSFESAAYRVTFASSSYILLLVYRPPPKTKPTNHPTAASNSFSSFFTDFSMLLEDLVSSPSELIITGDFNLHLDDPSCSKSSSFLSLLHTFHLSQLVSFPTHSDGHTLDLLITRASSSILSNIDYSILPSSFSDHSAILSSLNVPSSTRPPSSTKVIRNTKSIDIPSFSNDILSSPLFTTTAHSLSSYLDLFSSTIFLLLYLFLLLTFLPLTPLLFFHPFFPLLPPRFDLLSCLLLMLLALLISSPLFFSNLVSTFSFFLIPSNMLLSLPFTKNTLFLLMTSPATAPSLTSISFPKSSSASSTLVLSITSTPFLLFPLFNLPIASFIPLRLLFFASTMIYSSPLISKKSLLLFFLISLLPSTLLIIRFFSPDYLLTLVFLVLRSLFFRLIFIIALILFLLILISLPLLPSLPVFHRDPFSALSSSVSTLLLLLICSLTLLFLFICMLMTHNSTFLFPLLISTLVSLLSLLLSILSTTGFLPIVFPLIHQKLNSSSLVPPSSV